MMTLWALVAVRAIIGILFCYYLIRAIVLIFQLTRDYLSFRPWRQLVRGKIMLGISVVGSTAIGLFNLFLITMPEEVSMRVWVNNGIAIALGMLAVVGQAYIASCFEELRKIATDQSPNSLATLTRTWDVFQQSIESAREESLK